MAFEKEKDHWIRWYEKNKCNNIQFKKTNEYNKKPNNLLGFLF